ncbi:MAG: hypothetical protein NVS1B2_01190 [Vulcanimicrobiaceae bacterium]
MLLRRLGSSVPLAVFVAVLAHVAGFGSTHAPGSQHAIELLVALAVALAALAGGIVVRAALAAAGHRRVAHVPPSPLGHRLASAGVLAAFAALAFAAIEASEGNVIVDGSVRALVALLPIATLVTLLAPRARRALHAIGTRVAVALVAHVRRDGARFAARRLVRAIARSADRRGTRLGRAPPHIA